MKVTRTRLGLADDKAKREPMESRHRLITHKKKGLSREYRKAPNLKVSTNARAVAGLAFISRVEANSV